MTYTGFAALYDQLMSEAPYDQWIEYIKEASVQHDLTDVSLLDVGCGTGELLMLLLDEGMRVTGVDLSAEMLTIAQEKAMKKGYSPLLIEADMTSLETIDTFDIVTVFCDSLNYLPTQTAVQQAFAAFAKQLKQGGLLLFDVHSQHKISQFIGQTFADADEEASYIWTSYEGEEVDSVEHELTFFAKLSNNQYERLDELHYQRTFSIEQYNQWLEQAGFKVESITADFSNQQVHEESERIFIKAIKL